MIANPCFHCWRHPQCLVNPAEVAVHVAGRRAGLLVRDNFVPLGVINFPFDCSIPNRDLIEME
jgi:hypothetical protein